MTVNPRSPSQWREFVAENDGPGLRDAVGAELVRQGSLLDASQILDELARRPKRVEIKFTVLGRAQPAGSKKAFVNRHTGKVIVTEDAKKSKPWQQQVGDTALAHRDQLGGELLQCPLELDVTFVLARPKGHFGSGRNQGVVRASAPPRPAVKPDTTKLLRAVEDALTGVLWRDDALIVDQSARKVYGAPERVEITVRPAA